MSGPRLNRETFLEVAAAISEVAESAETEDEERAVRLIAEAIADRFSRRAQAFDRDLFLYNSGVIDHG